MVKSGPMDVAGGNSTGSALVVPMIYSKREYFYLKEEGYKEAKRLAIEHSVRSKPMPNQVHISGGTFTNSPIGLAHHLEQAVNVSVSSIAEASSALRSEVLKQVNDQQQRDNIIARLDELEAANDKPTMLQRYNALVASIGDHITVLGFLLPPLLEKLLS